MTTHSLALNEAGRQRPVLDVTSPFSGEVVGRVVADDAVTIAAALRAARRAWQEFRRSTPFERKTLLFALADKLAGEAEPMAQLISAEVGKTIAEARNEVRRAQNTLRLSAEAAIVLHGEVLPCAVVAGAPDKVAQVSWQPAGVVGAITPFNYPLNLLCHKLGPAIAAGNAVVAKPSPKAPLAAARLAELAEEAGFPEGLFSVVHGGAEAAAVLASGDIDILSFTGGPQAGLALKNASGLVRCLMELGGNDPLIVLPDADLDRAADTAIAHRFEIAGQSCAAVKKLYLHDDIHDAMIERLIARIAEVVTGDPADAATVMGPVIDEAAAAEVERRMRKAAAEGGRILAGGTRRGTLVAPTLIDDVPASTDLVKSETFGPVLAVRRFTAIDTVITEVDDSPYGLQAGIFTNDHALVRCLSRQLRVGGVMVNEGPDFRAENVPFGGIKSSGLGREGIHVTLREMSELKVVID
ncbi:acyl-CoA reductase-like NAD-dependent aldehyde dehydrogenase [Chelatococcus caeni]|uniref:Acyl-CoA reductase-like NAD-dependent aldehyde dehydrogenase n=1 Tax=Chelatococcus caeni TaxID=1348468 RepID=A0A840BZS4_9HYPH|nr:aldehyde dehydrogenase family protein [Chelatococcus caeni]MBB4018835.1 acyl-CoA reductase-like NAD-dependent aldehyde dehydrogenase [Chelatococcus caeni]